MSEQHDHKGATPHRTVGYVKTYDPSRLANLKIHLQDYLFDKGHTINKAMIDDLALFVYDLNESHYHQGKITTTTSSDWQLTQIDTKRLSDALGDPTL